MPLRVPPEDAAILKRWLELPVEEAEKFSRAIEKARPQFNADELARAVMASCDLDPRVVSGVVGVLVRIYRTGEPKKPFDTFLDRDVRPALRRAKTFSEGREEDEWGRLRRFLLHALLLEGIVGTTAKAGDVLTQHERIFDSARIMTDFRPIFHVDVSESPNAGVIIHMLRITRRDQHDQRFDAYYALDSNDLARLRDILDRAAEKEKALRRAMDVAGLTVLDVKPYY